jgi:hypothetical protein
VERNHYKLITKLKKSIVGLNVKAQSDEALAGKIYLRLKSEASD